MIPLHITIKKLNSKKGLLALLSKEPLNIFKAIRYVDYQHKLEKLQVELIRLQTWAINNNERIIVIFEGRDAAGKGGLVGTLGQDQQAGADSDDRAGNCSSHC